MAAPPSHTRPCAVPRFYFGAAYYPEQGEFATLDLDLERMLAAGMNVVRLGEFAWDVFEPEDGRWDFSLLERTIRRLGERGIESILCTPSAAPPRWLTAAHPELLKRDANGVSMQHGSRQHASYAHPLFREYSRRITRRLAEQFRLNPHVIGFQTDNEIHCHMAEDHSPAARAAFQEYLRQKFEGRIELLNRAWGTSFWAQTYARFEEIPTPVSQKPTYENPSQLLDYARFLAACVSHFQREQIEILREVQPRWWITHNGCFRRVDYRGEFGALLDFLGYDVYPMFTVDPRQRGADQAYSLDAARAWTGNFLVPEHQSGPGAQGNYMHDTPEPGELRRMVYTTLARGADGLLFFRFRSCPFGAEEYWCGVLDHDNQPRRRYREVAAMGDELRVVGPRLLGTSVRIEVAIAAASLDNAEAHESLPLGLPKPSLIAAGLHREFLRRGYAVGCVHPTDDLSPLRLYLIPHWVIIDPAWVPALSAWVESGGVLVIGARSGTRDLDNQVVQAPLPGCLRDLAGVTVVEYGPQNRPEERPLYLQLTRGLALSQNWYERLELEPDTEVLARWCSRHLAGTPAVTLRRHGRGAVVYVATYLVGDTANLLVPELASESGLDPQIAEPPAELEIVQRRGPTHKLWFLINHADSETTVAHPPPGRNLLTATEVQGPLRLDPYGVAVIEQPTP